jgi:hypothetical protein
MSSRGDFRDVKHRTIFHDLLDSKILPPEDKTVNRLWQEAQLLLAAGTVTTATSIASALVYLLLDQVRLIVLLEELEASMPDITKPRSQSELEQLPYLVSLQVSGVRAWLTIFRVQSFKKPFALSLESHIVSSVLLPPKLSNWANGQSHQM